MITFAAFACWAFIAAAEAANPSFMDIDQVQRGMRGIGKTVFTGTTIDTFAVEILGVAQHRLGPRRHMILAQLSGGPLAQTGVMQGMSGSPVYIDGRLIGAVAYTWSFAQIPIAGITPIHDMLAVFERGLEPPQDYGTWAPFELDAQTATLLPQSATVPDRITLEPLGTPVWASGFGAAATRMLDDTLGPFGLHVTTGVDGGGTIDEAAPFEPGAALGVQLVSGDMSITGIGTLTYVDGDRVLGFGHPMLLEGATDMPMTGAFIYAPMPSRFLSFKLGAPTRILGAVRQDRAAAIAGVVGPVPAMLPLRVLVRTDQGETTYTCQVLRHQRLTSGLTASVLLGVLEAVSKRSGPTTLQVRSTIAFEDGQDLQREQIHSGAGALFQAAITATQPLVFLSQNPFDSIRLQKVDFELEIKENLELARVRALRVAERQLKPGDTFTLEVELQPYRQAAIKEHIQIALPADLKPGPLTLRVGNGSASQEWELERSPALLQPRTLAQLRQLLQRQDRNDNLVVELYRQEDGISVAGRELPGLPPSARTILQQENSTGRLGAVHGRVVLRQRQRTNYVLAGTQTLELTIGKP
jgi:hypothetical protein